MAEMASIHADQTTIPSDYLASFVIHAGNNLDVLPTLPDNSVDSIVTDPPYELGFMGKKWDSSGIAYSVELWTECLRVLKPGGHLLAFSGSRTYHRMVVAIEDAGFDVRDMISWISNKTFPKSLDVSKAIDKNNGKHQVDLKPFGEYVKCSREAKGFTRSGLDTLMKTNTAVSWWEGRASGIQLPSKETYNRLKPILEMDNRFDDLIDWAEAEREVIGKSSTGASEFMGSKLANKGNGLGNEVLKHDITAASTPEAQKWQGWGTGLKPTVEPIVMARKPLSGTVAANVLEHGTGALNIDGSRIGTEDKTARVPSVVSKDSPAGFGFSPAMGGNGSPLGRWPANVILDEYSAGELDKQSGVSQSPGGTRRVGGQNGIFKVSSPEYLSTRPSDSGGGASRFFYVARASKRDRNEGLESNNSHPTVKPTTLMRYLVKLVTPPGGTVLDPFTGSGSTGKAAILEGFDFIGIELTEEYLPIIDARLKHAEQVRDQQEQAKDEGLF
jgi:DNA modification methylase